jgi:hypothetical protein
VYLNGHGLLNRVRKLEDLRAGGGCGSTDGNLLATYNRFYLMKIFFKYFLGQY